MYESTKKQQGENVASSGSLSNIAKTIGLAGNVNGTLTAKGYNSDKIHALEDARSVLKGHIEATKNKMDEGGWYVCQRQLEKALTHLEDARMWFGKCIETLEESK